MKFPEILPEDETPWINDPIQKNRQQNFELKKENAKDYSFDKKLLNELDGMKQVCLINIKKQLFLFMCFCLFFFVGFNFIESKNSWIEKWRCFKRWNFMWMQRNFNCIEKKISWIGNIYFWDLFVCVEKNGLF